MQESFHVRTTVPLDRVVKITLPADVPIGPIDLVIQFSTAGEQRVYTFGDLLRSPIFGMWADRQDMGDSIQFARRLREQAWKRDE